MLFLYNILQLIFLPLLAPLLFIISLVTPKYRGRMVNRIGLGIKSRILPPVKGQTTIWLHALSVGEVTSAVPLAEGLRKKYSSARIVFTVSTRSGEIIARNLLTKTVDHILPSPLDILPVVMFFYSRIKPQIFILVETDFWPNFLLYLQYKKTPTVLVNGRVSAKSMSGYKRFPFFFRPMFDSFSCLLMQTESDKQNMNNLGINREKIMVPGNLKFDTQITEKSIIPLSLSKLLPGDTLVITAGSTHQGEEDMLFTAFKRLQISHPKITLVLAPRDLDRADQIRIVAKQHGLTTLLRSRNDETAADILLVDSIGELNFFYAMADIAFVGGSLVNEGGHNPVEPAIFGIPVLFGPYMQDFHEIAGSLVEEGGGEQVTDAADLEHALTLLMDSEDLRSQRGAAAKHYVNRQRGVVEKHLKIIQTLL
ncbi:MAG: 3-deoxy-D-manno-octulosonic acid transferase [Deltaproteobacteria bacterium]|nr:3-deoxy-D-manno-octulosonic acid transferase [Deltaproteobacteria bacterium]MBW2658550.1 3-deoxy-D-manno-octulosonic acid transferase [Deltaproteobacteria bacterium]